MFSLKRSFFLVGWLSMACISNYTAIDIQKYLHTTRVPLVAQSSFSRSNSETILSGVYITVPEVATSKETAPRISSQPSGTSRHISLFHRYITSYHSLSSLRLRASFSNFRDHRFKRFSYMGQHGGSKKSSGGTKVSRPRPRPDKPTPAARKTKH